MKTYHYGLILGSALALIIFLSNVVFPSAGSDWTPGELLVAALIGLYIIFSARHAARHSKLKNTALRVGFATSVIGFLMAMATFLIVDNLWLGIVSQQADKVYNFSHGNYSSMRSMINWGLLHGLLFGLPASAVFGLICGYIASKLPRK